MAPKIGAREGTNPRDPKHSQHGTGKPQRTLADDVATDHRKAEQQQAKAQRIEAPLRVCKPQARDCRQGPDDDPKSCVTASQPTPPGERREEEYAGHSDAEAQVEAARKR